MCRNGSPIIRERLYNDARVWTSNSETPAFLGYSHSLGLSATPTPYAQEILKEMSLGALGYQKLDFLQNLIRNPEGNESGSSGLPEA